MKKLTVLTEGQTEELELDESFIIKNENPYLLVKKATVFWKYNNITTAFGNNEITYNNVKKTIEDGYWTFNMLKKEIESYGNVTLEANKYGTCSITMDNTINMKKLGPLLGFNKNQVINASDGKTKSGEHVDIDNGLEYIEVSCSLVTMKENINSNSRKSNVIVALPITSTQSLNGGVQYYFDIESRVQIDKGVINKINFNVQQLNIGKVLLDLYIM